LNVEPEQFKKSWSRMKNRGGWWLFITTQILFLIAVFWIVPQPSRLLLFFIIVPYAILTMIALVSFISADIQIEQALRDSEHRLQIFTNALPDRVVIIGSDGIYYDVLKVDYDTNTIGRTNTTGRHLTEVFDKKFANFCMKVVHEVIETQQPRILEYPYEDNGMTYYLEGRIVPFTDLATRKSRVMWISRDISERKRIEQAIINSEKRLWAFAEALPDRAVILDNLGRYRAVLKRQYESARFEPPDATNQTLYDILDKTFADYCLNMVHKTLAENTLQVIEYQNVVKGQLLHFEGHVAPFTDPETGERLVIWVSRDITDRVQSEQTIAYSEKRLRTLAESLPDRAVILDKDGNYQDVLQSKTNNDPHTRADVIGLNIAQLYDKDFVDFCLKMIDKALEEDKTVAIDYIYGQGGTDEVHVEGHLTPLNDLVTGKRVVMWVSRDVTERRRSEQAIINSEKRLRALAQSLPDRVVIFDKLGGYVDVLQARQANNNYNLPNPIGKSLHEVHPIAFADFCLRKIQETLDGHQGLIFEYERDFDGIQFYVEGRTVPFIEPQTGEPRVIWVSRDITERKQSEFAVQEYGRFQQLITAIAANFINTPIEKIDERIPEVLQQVAEFIGADRGYIFSRTEDLESVGLIHEWHGEQIPSMQTSTPRKSLAPFTWSSAIFERFETMYIPRVADLPPEAAVEKASLQGSGVQSAVVVPLVSEEQWVGTLGFHTVLKEQVWTKQTTDLLRVVGEIYINAVQRKQAEERLQYSEQQLRTLVKALPDRTVIFDSAGIYHETLKVYYETSVTAEVYDEDREGHHISEYYSQEFAAFCLEKISDALQSQKTQVFEYDCPTRGKPYRFEARVIPYQDSQTGQPRVYWVTRDITERIFAEQQRIELTVEREKLDFLREFMDSMTHDLKTPLTVINMNLEFIQRTQDETKKQQRLENIRRQSDIITHMLDDMLAMARLDNLPDLEFQTLNLQTLLEDVMLYLQPKAESLSQAVDMRIETDALEIRGSENEMRRALTNLIDNAIKYTPHGGAISVCIYCENTKTVIEVKDTGIGIKADEVSQVFNRFFRSANAKSHAAGTGLGLAITKRIIELHHGQITAESVYGQGSTFRVWLPNTTIHSA
jgi:PAS domain S-box-containing protein